jgi:hypothetical protein
MLKTETRPNPSILAALAAKRKNTALVSNSVPAAPRPKPAPPRQRKPYTTQSEGYEVQRNLPALPVKATTPDSVPVPSDVDPLGLEVIDFEVDDTQREPEHTNSWMLGVEALGMNWTPRLKRSTIIDEVDPTEALDMDEEFLGFHLVTW